MKYLMIIAVMGLLLLSLLDKKNKQKYIIFSGVVLILYSTFRFYLGGNVVIGNDYLSYQTWFNSIDKINIWNVSNVLFNILLLLIKKVFNNYIIFVFLTSTFFVFSIYKFSIKNTIKNSYVIAIFVFLTIGIYELGMSAIRQWIAGSIFLLSVPYIKEKNFFKYFISLLIAGFFHNSAWILIFIYPIINIKLEFKIKILFAFIFTFILYIFTYLGLDFKFAAMLDPTFLIKYQELNDELLSNYTLFIISFSCFFGIMLFYKKYCEYSSNHQFELCYLMLLVSISLLATTSALCGRFLQYFIPALTLVIPNIINIFDGKMKKILMSIAVISLLLIYIL